jgi:hypothetical protein
MRPRAIAAVVVVLLGAGAAIAGSDDKTGIDPAARSQLEQVAAAYRGLAHYADEGRFVTAFDFDGKLSERVTPLKWTVARSDDPKAPLKLRLEGGMVTVVADGSRLVQAVGPTRRYLVTSPQPTPLRPDTLTEGPAGAELLGGPSAGASRILLALLLTDDAPARLLETGTTLQVWPAAEGETTPIGLILTTPSGLRARLAIEPSTHLLKRIELTSADASPGAEIVPGRSLRSVRLVWEAGNVTTDPAPPPAAFQWTAPEGYVELKQP